MGGGEVGYFETKFRHYAKSKLLAMRGFSRMGGEGGTSKPNLVSMVGVKLLVLDFKAHLVVNMSKPLASICPSHVLQTASPQNAVE